MEEGGMEDGGGRWPSYSPHEHDLRMQDRVRDYDPYDFDSRQPARSGHYADTGQPPRGPANMKTLLANQQAAGRRGFKPSPVAHHVIRKEGPNWILIAGGALVAAIGVMIVRRQKPAVPKPKVFEKAPPAPGKDHVQQSGLSFATTRRESTGSRTSELSTDSPYSGDPYMLAQTHPQSLSEGSRVGSDWGDEECIPLSPPAMYYSQFPKASSHSNRTVITPTSPPGSYRGADTSATECNDPIALSPPARMGFSSRRDMVHRLRQQLKSRDEMILDMQAQISDQERSISLHQAHCRDLERQLEDVTTTLLESDIEIRRLRKAVAEYLAGHSPVGDLDGSPASDHGGSAHQTHQQDDNFLMREARRLAEELRVQEDEKLEMERLASIRMQEHELVVQKLQVLEAELEEARKSDFGKDLLLEAYEVEHENLEDKMDNMKRQMETKTPEKSPSSSSMIGRNSLSGGLGILRLDHENGGHRAETGSSAAEDFRVQARNLVRSYSALFERNSEQQRMDLSSVRGQLKTDESSSNGDISDESEMEDLNPAFSEKMVMKLQQEVEQLSVIFADRSNMMSEKRLETSRLVDEFQRHNALINDIQKRMDEDVDRTPEGQEPDWDSHSQNLSFSNDSTSAAQVQELSHKLEQIAKQQRVEEEIADLSKHQVKIAELKQRVEKLLNKCRNVQDSNGSFDAATHQQASRMAAAGFELARQLDLQEEQARRTSREVQRLSASFQLSSPYVPRSKKEELREMLQACSSESLSPPLASGPPETTNMSRILPVLQSRFSTGSEGKPKESGDFLFDRALSVSSAEPATTAPQSEGGLRLQKEEHQYVYRPGFSGPSTRKSRRGFPIHSWSGKEQSPGARKRMARGFKYGASREPDKELVTSDSNRWVDRGSGLSEESSCSASNIEHQGPESEYMQGLEGSRSQSCGCLSDSSTMRMGSPPNTRHNVSLETSFESTKSSLGGFLFDMEVGDQVYAMSQEGGGQDDIAAEDTTSSQSSPCTEMMAKLDIKEVSLPSGPNDTGSLGSNISGLSTDMLQAGSNKKSRSTSSGSSISIDSSFEDLLSNTLDDLVRVCSTPSTPAETPESSSFMSSQSDAFLQ